MLFSVVMPTHNRLHLLCDAIETVRRQDVADWELVVFDNASTDPIADHIRSIADTRVHYARSEEFLPVTSSWNHAISLAKGDYVVLLGDDDGLTPGYFRRLGQIIREFKFPDVVYNNIYQFWHRGVAPWEPSAYVIDVRHGFFFDGRKDPFVLTHDEARQAALGSVRLQINFSFNSQAIVYKREFLKTLSSDGPVYRSPFPDYYIANVALMRSQSTVVVPEPLAVAGVSKASFGFTMYNDQDERGAALLNTDLPKDPVFQELQRFVLPGPAYNTNCLVAMEYVAKALPELAEHVDVARYRRMQIYAALESLVARKAASDAWPSVSARLSLSEHAWAWYVERVLNLSARNKRAGHRLLARVKRSVNIVGSDPMVRHCGRHDFKSVTDLYDAIAAGTLA